MNTPPLPFQKQWVDIACKFLDFPGGIMPEEVIERKEGGPFWEWFPGTNFDPYYNLVTRHLNEHASKIALVCVKSSGSATEVTYKHLDSLVRKVAFKLKSAGLSRPGLRLAVIGAPGLETTTAILASAFLGCHHTVLIPSLSKEAISKRLDVFQPDLVVQDVGVSINSSVPSLNISIQGEEVEFDSIPVEKSFPLEAESSTYNSGDSFLTLFTSGSTGFPKGITHSCLGYLLYGSYTASYFFGLDSSGRILCGSHAGWINGHTYAIYAPLLLLASTILVDEPAKLAVPSFLEECLSSYGVTILYLPVTTVRLLRALSGSRPVFTSSALKSLGTMGEMLSPSIEEWYTSYYSQSLLPVVNTYFQTETGGILVANKFTDSPGISVGEIGEVPWFASFNSEDECLKLDIPVPGLMIDIISSDKTRELSSYFCSHYYSLNDYGNVRAGRLYVHGRSDDVLNLRGVRVGSGEIEACVVSIPWIVECAAVESIGALGSGELILFVCVDWDGYCSAAGYGSSGKVAFEEIAQKLLAGIGAHVRLHRLIVCKDLPKTPSGKILRRFLKRINVSQVLSYGGFPVTECLTDDVSLEISLIV